MRRIRTWLGRHAWVAAPSGPAAESEIVADAPVTGAVNALRAARRLLADELESIYDMACPRDRRGRLRLDLIDSNYKALVRRYKRVLHDIDEALP